jgi:hypothetical protein
MSCLWRHRRCDGVVPLHRAERNTQLTAALTWYSVSKWKKEAPRSEMSGAENGPGGARPCQTGPSADDFDGFFDVMMGFVDVLQSALLQALRGGVVFFLSHIVVRLVH